jgi:hypothetical protein
MCLLLEYTFNQCLIQAVTQQNVEKVKGCEYFLYMLTVEREHNTVNEKDSGPQLSEPYRLVYEEVQHQLTPDILWSKIQEQAVSYWDRNIH